MTCLEDWFLMKLQRRCQHPDDMVAVDLLEGCADGIEVAYCRRCGAVKTDWNPDDDHHRFISLDHCWRRPDPFLWREGSRFMFALRLRWEKIRRPA